MFLYLIAIAVTSLSVWDYKHLAGHLVSSCYIEPGSRESRWTTAGEFTDGMNLPPHDWMPCHCNKIHRLTPWRCRYVVKKHNARGLHAPRCSAPPRSRSFFSQLHFRVMLSSLVLDVVSEQAVRKWDNSIRKVKDKHLSLERRWPSRLPSWNQKGCSIPHKTAYMQRLAEDKTKHQIKNLNLLEYLLRVQPEY